MVRDKHRPDPVNECRQACEMHRINPLRGAQGKAHSVYGDRIIRAQRFEIGDRLASAHITLGVDFEPADSGTIGPDFSMVREAKTDPCCRGDLLHRQCRSWAEGVHVALSVRAGSGITRG